MGMYSVKWTFVQYIVQYIVQYFVQYTTKQKLSMAYVQLQFELEDFRIFAFCSCKLLTLQNPLKDIYIANEF